MHWHHIIYLLCIRILYYIDKASMNILFIKFFSFLEENKLWMFKYWYHLITTATKWKENLSEVLILPNLLNLSHTPPSALLRIKPALVGVLLPCWPWCCTPVQCQWPKTGPSSVQIQPGLHSRTLYQQTHRYRRTHTCVHAHTHGRGNESVCVWVCVALRCSLDHCPFLVCSIPVPKPLWKFLRRF